MVMEINRGYISILTNEISDMKISIGINSNGEIHDFIVKCEKCKWWIAYREYSISELFAEVINHTCNVARG